MRIMTSSSVFACVTLQMYVTMAVMAVGATYISSRPASSHVLVTAADSSRQIERFGGRSGHQSLQPAGTKWMVNDDGKGKDVKSNSIVIDSSRSHVMTAFKNDKEIVQFLHSNGQQAMIWRCRNAIKPQLNASLVEQHVDLYCEVIGTIQTVTWFHNGTPIGTKDFETSSKSRYRQRITPHIINQRRVRRRRRQGHVRNQGHGSRVVYSRWIDFRLRILRATSRDSGTYVFRVTSPGGDITYQLIHVDLTDH